jgi:hypothetical protein
MDDPHILKVFADKAAGGAWFAKNGPEGIAFVIPR